MTESITPESARVAAEVPPTRRSLREAAARRAAEEAASLPAPAVAPILDTSVLHPAPAESPAAPVLQSAPADAPVLDAAAVHPADAAVTPSLARRFRRATPDASAPAARATATAEPRVDAAPAVAAEAPTEEPRTRTASPTDPILLSLPFPETTGPIRTQSSAPTEEATHEAPSRGRRAPRRAAGRRSSFVAAPREPRRRMRSTVIAALIVPALFGTAGLPAFATTDSAQASSDGVIVSTSATALIRGEVRPAQSLTVSDTVSAEVLDRGSYSTANGALKPSEYDSLTALGGYSGPSSQGWWRPLPGPITSPYGPRNLICNSVGCSNSFNEGMDFAGSSGTSIRAIADGVVTFVGNAGAYGNRVIVDHGEGVSSVYGHLLTGSAKVAVGDTVQGGTVIAGVGATGVVSGPHLDLKIEIFGEMTDPAAFLRSKGVPAV